MAARSRLLPFCTQRQAPHARLLLLLLLLLFCTACCCLENKRDTVRELTDADQDLLLQGEWLVKFYADWCGACRQFEPTYRKAAETLAKDLPGLQVAAVNIENNAALAARFQVTALPTVYYISRRDIWSPVYELPSAESLIRSVQEVKQTGRRWSGFLHPFGTIANALGWFGWLSGSVIRLWRSLPWWSFWVGVVVLMGLTVWAVFLEEEPPHAAVIEDRTGKRTADGDEVIAATTASELRKGTTTRSRKEGVKR